MVFNELSLMQEILANSIYSYDISNEFLLWIKYTHYPVINLVEEAPFEFKLSQNFNTTSHDKWWIPIRLISNLFVYESIDRVVVSSQEFSLTIVAIPDHWTILDIQQAGKYMSRNYLYTLCNYFTFYVIIFQQLSISCNFLIRNSCL